jgi:hypothetical protein
MSVKVNELEPYISTWIYPNIMEVKRQVLLPTAIYIALLV